MELAYNDIHGLKPGDEIDYNACDDYWVPARVESVAQRGRFITVRFVCGPEEFTRTVDLRSTGSSTRWLDADALCGAGVF
jgi:hypothetical protein